jgi:hypothetical protein
LVLVIARRLGIFCRSDSVTGVSRSVQSWPLGTAFSGLPLDAQRLNGVRPTSAKGTRIGRVELDGRFFAIQDIQFNFVPEPATFALVACGPLLVMGRRGR